MTRAPVPARQFATVLAAVIATALFAAACSADPDTTESAGDEVAATSTTTAGDAAESVSWLFSTGADRATFTPTDTEGTYTLELTGVDDRTTAFSDRPERQAASLATTGILDQWTQIFGDDPPNAVITERTGNGAATSVVVELTNPSTTDVTTTFTAVTIPADDTSTDNLELATAPTDDPAPTDMGPVSIFIDDVSVVPDDPSKYGNYVGWSCASLTAVMVLSLGVVATDTQFEAAVGAVCEVNLWESLFPA